MTLKVMGRNASGSVRLSSSDESVLAASLTERFLDAIVEPGVASRADLLRRRCKVIAATRV